MPRQSPRSGILPRKHISALEARATPTPTTASYEASSRYQGTRRSHSWPAKICVLILFSLVVPRRMDIESFFQDTLNAIKLGLDTQLTGTSPDLAVRQSGGYVTSYPASPTFQTVLLVGGFATSPYLHTKLQEYATSKGVRMFYPDGQT